MAGEKDRVDGHLATVARLEPEINPIDASAFYASAAISLKRLADAAEVANKLAVMGIEFKHRRDKAEQENWLRRHGLADLIPPEA